MESCAGGVADLDILEVLLDNVPVVVLHHQHLVSGLEFGVWGLKFRDSRLGFNNSLFKV